MINPFEKYKLTDADKEAAFKNILQLYSHGKHPVKNPVAVIVGGQTGAGKSGLIAYSTKMFKDDNVIIIEDDDFRPFYPNAAEIAEKFPNDYIQITNQLTNSLTSSIFGFFSSQHFNIIFHQTLKNTRIADEGIPMLKNENYCVVVRGLSVHEFESKYSMIDREVQQLNLLGYCRPVTFEDHDKTYNGMPNTIDYIEKNEKADVLEVFTRGETEGSPKLVYSKINEHSDKLDSISDKDFVSHESFDNGFESAKESLEKSRESEKVRFLSDAESKLDILSHENMDPFIQNQFAILKEHIFSNDLPSNIQ